MLRFFRINDPYRLLGLLLIAILLGLPHLIYPSAILLSELKFSIIGEAIADGKMLYYQIIDDTAPLLGYVFGIKEFLFGRSLLAGKIIALIIIIFQSSYFAILLINNKAYTENNYVPAIIFGLLCFVSFDMLSLSTNLLASTALLFSLNQLFHELEFKIQRDDYVLKVGFYVGIATLFLFSYWVFLIICAFILIAFARASFRKISLLIFGFFLPHALLALYYYYHGQAYMLWANFYLPNFSFSGEMVMSAKSLLIIGIVPLVYFIFSIFMVGREARFTKYQSQLMQVMFLWLITSLIQILISREVSPASLFPMMPPLAYFISHFLLLIRRKWRAELTISIFLIGIVTMNFLGKYNKLKPVDYSQLFPVSVDNKYAFNNKKIMHLSDGINIYNENKLSGFFLNWDLSEKYFKNLSVYDHVELIAASFETDPPQIIIDPNNYMEQVMYRIPYIKRNYKKSGNYWEINN